MDYLLQLGLFAGKSALIVICIVIVLIVFFGLLLRQKSIHHLEIENLNEKHRDLSNLLKSQVLNKQEAKVEKKEAKKIAKQMTETSTPKAFVLDFEGDIRATAVNCLREEITTILKVAKSGDEVIVRLESSGGMVHGYGLAAAQLQRVKDARIALTVCVDKVAASGGYMMACVADKIIASPFAILGSIGVLAQVPNIHRLLKKHDIDYQEITAGEYKRTVSLLGEITPQGKEKFQEQVVDTHQLFKNFVLQQRPKLDVSKVATGEYWFGIRAKELNLVDEIATSDAYILQLEGKYSIFRVAYEAKKKLSEKIAAAVHMGLDRTVEKWIYRNPTDSLF